MKQSSVEESGGQVLSFTEVPGKQNRKRKGERKERERLHAVKYLTHPFVCPFARPESRYPANNTMTYNHVK